MSDWKIFRIDEIGEIVTGSTPSTKVSENWNGVVPFYSPSDFHGQVYCQKTEKTISEQALAYSRPIPKNAVMFACIASIGKMAISIEPGITNQQINTLVTKSNCFYFLFIYYILLLNRNSFISIAPQTTIPIINKTDFSSFSISCPTSFHEQRKIARILSILDAVIEKTEAAIAKYQAIKAGMMQDLFTRGIDLATGKLRPSYEDAPELYKQSELGWVPKEWDVVSIQYFAKLKGGKRLPAGHDFAEVETRHPYLRVTDMVDGTINQNDLKYVTYETETIIRPYKISVQDIYVTIAGTLGLFGTIPSNLDNAQLTENAAKITDYDEEYVNRDYLMYQCNSALIQAQIQREIGVGGGVPKLALFRIARFFVKRPNMQEQELVVMKLNQAKEQWKCETGNLAKHKSLKQALMSDLLTGKVRVKYNENETETV